MSKGADSQLPGAPWQEGSQLGHRKIVSDQDHVRDVLGASEARFEMETTTVGLRTSHQHLSTRNKRTEGQGKPVSCPKEVK